MRHLLQASLDPRSVCAVKSRAAVVCRGLWEPAPCSHNCWGAAGLQWVSVISFITRCPQQIWWVRNEGSGHLSRAYPGRCLPGGGPKTLRHDGVEGGQGHVGLWPGWQPLIRGGAVPSHTGSLAKVQKTLVQLLVEQMDKSQQPTAARGISGHPGRRQRTRGPSSLEVMVLLCVVLLRILGRRQGGG